MFIAKITVTLRKSILDPQGKAVLHGAHSLGYAAVNDIRIGKFIEMKIDAPTEAEARRVTEEICQKLLANPVMEDYRYTMELSI
ncbi:MAG: phosphoribosylformylglycinamidine synthase subunit PurS [Bacteroidota bacterium]